MTSVTDFLTFRIMMKKSHDSKHLFVNIDLRFFFNFVII